MAVRTSNIYGKIVVSDHAIAMVANKTASECYGVADLVSRKLTDSIMELFNKMPDTKGIRIECVKNKINIEVFAVLIEGVNIEAVSESVKSAIKYNVETFTGMRVNKITVNVVGVRVK